MKYIIVGLGSFGATLAQKLTMHGNEVIGIDNKMEKVDSLKDVITHTICLDATDEYTVKGLPLYDTDVVIITIGEDEGHNIMATALFKNLGVKNIICRVISPLQEKVIAAIGVNKIIKPEEEIAEKWAKKLSLSGVIDSFEFSGNYSMVEAEIPSKLVGKTIREVNFLDNYELIVLTTIKSSQVKSMIGGTKKVTKVQGIITRDLLLEKDDILVLYGENKNIKKFLENA